MQTEKRRVGRPVVFTKDEAVERKAARDNGHIKLRFYGDLADNRKIIEDKAKELGYPTMQKFLMAAALSFNKKYVKPKKKPTSK